MTGSAPSRLIRAHGTAVSVIDEYHRHAGSDGASDLFKTYYFERADTHSIVERAGTFTRSYLTSGVEIDDSTIMAFFPGGPESSKVEAVPIRADSEDVPADEQLPVMPEGERPLTSETEPEPSKDYYGASYLNDDVNGGSFEVVNVVFEDGLRRVQGELSPDSIEPEPRP